MKSPDHDHITPRETFPITHHDNAETPKTLNNKKNLSVPAKRHSRLRSKSRSRSQSTPKTPKTIVDASENVDTSLKTSIDTSQNLKESELSTHLVKNKEVTDLHSDDNNSDILSENESERPSTQTLFELTTGRKRKERSPQETTNNPYKKINMGNTDIGNMKLEQQLTEEEAKDIESLSPELAKVTKILLRRNEHRFTEL